MPRSSEVKTMKSQETFQGLLGTVRPLGCKEGDL